MTNKTTRAKTRRLEFNKLKKMVKKGCDQGLILQQINLISTTVEDDLDTYIDLIEFKNKPQCDISERFIEVLNTESSNSRITVNSVSGRITLKVSNKASEIVKKEMTEFAKSLLEQDFPPVTLRGKVTFNQSSQCYEWYGVSENKRTKIMKRSI